MKKKQLQQLNKTFPLVFPNYDTGIMERGYQQETYIERLSPREQEILNKAIEILENEKLYK